MKTLFSLVLFTLLFAACTPDRDEPCRSVHIDTIPLDASLNSLLPYELDDSALYRHNNNDSVYFHVVRISRFMETQPVEINPECDPDLRIIENKRVTYVSKDTSVAITYNILNLKRVLSINRNDPYSLILQEFPEQEMLTGKPFADSMEVQTKIYERVFKAISNYDTVYFNREFGFIKIVRNTDKWELIR